MEKSYVLLADGFETIEALTPVDIFHRLGLDIVQVSTTGSLQVASSHRVHVTADCTLDQADMSQAALIYLPGGYPGYVNLCNNEQVVDLARRQYQSGRLPYAAHPWCSRRAASPLAATSPATTA